MNQLLAVTVAATAGAVMLLVPAAPRLGAPHRTGRGSTRASGLLVLTAGTLWVVIVADLRGTHLALAGVLATAAVAVQWLSSQAGRARTASGRRQQVVDYGEALAGELASGQPVLHALERALAVWPESAPVVAAARLDADVPSALRMLGERPGAGALARLAGAWELCSDSGSGLAFAVEQVVETARAEQTTDLLVQGELASARATARLVAALPVVVLLAAQGMGARSWSFLLSTPPGVACLGTGLALALLGMWWIDRIAVTAASAG